MYLIFDFLVLLLICLPAIGGGFWIHRPHLKFELTELAVPVVIIFVIGTILQRSRGNLFEKSWTIRKGVQAFEKWRAFISARPVWAIAFGTVFISLLWAYAALRRHWALGSNGFDLGIFTNTIWNLTHGNGYISSIKDGINLFADHQSPIFWAFAPVFSLFPRAETLLVLQAISLALGAGAVFAIGKQYKKETTLLVAALPLLYWVYLPIRRANLFDFHPEVLMLPLFLWAIAGIQSRTRARQVWGWIAFLAALACKESAGPVAAGIGLAWVLGAGPESAGGKRSRARGSVAIALGLAVFAFDLREIPSLVAGGSAAGAHYVYGSLYSHLRSGPMEWVRSLLGHARIHFLFATLAPLAFLPLLAPRAFVAALPGYLMLFLSAGDSRLSLQYHYAIEPAVGLFWALAAATVSIPPLFRNPRRLALWVAFWALVCFGRSEVYWIRRYEPSAHASWLKTRVAECLSANTRLAASGPLVAQVATRRWIQQIPDLGTTSQPDDCVWVDESLNNWPLGASEFKAWEARLGSLGYERFFECGTTRIYQRQSYSGACLRCMPDCPN